MSQVVFMLRPCSSCWARQEATARAVRQPAVGGQAAASGSTGQQQQLQRAWRQAAAAARSRGQAQAQLQARAGGVQ